jgi:flagellar protein FlaG
MMENKLSSVAAAAELDPLGASKPAAHAQTRRPDETPAPDLRLVIEDRGPDGGFVYKTIDRRTGEVVLQLPREEVLRMRETAGYEAGSVIATRA